MFAHAFTYRIPYEQTAKFVPLTGLTRLPGSCEDGACSVSEISSHYFLSTNLDVFI